jgi:hypothetical protein
MPRHEYGVEGRHLTRVALRRILVWSVPMLAVAILMVAVAFMHLPVWLSLIAILLVPAYPAALKRWERGASKAVDPVLTGLEGERELAATLRAALGDDYYLVHDVDFGRGNVDHVAIGPAGIFTIETKADLGKVTTEEDELYVNRISRTRDLKQAYAEAMVVRDYLQEVSRTKDRMTGQRYYVTPLLVFTRANVYSYGACRGVFVMDLDRLPGFIKNEKRADARLTLEQRSRIAAALSPKVAK